MKIEHVAIWCNSLESMSSFYQHYFGAKSSDKYENKAKKFSSYFLTLPEGARIELMSMASFQILPSDLYVQFTGLAHMAFSVGSEDKDIYRRWLRSSRWPTMDGGWLLRKCDIGSRRQPS